MSEGLSSTDSVRSDRPLAHVQKAHFPGPYTLEGGGSLPEVVVAYETFGQLNDARDNAVLVCHAISGDSHVAKHDDTDDPGWWDQLVGPGKPVDTDRWFVICPNVLGGCRGTTGPNTIDPRTGERYGPDFPAVTINDMADTHARLLDELDIDTLHAAVGGSLGGHQVMTLSIRHPPRVKHCVAIATSPRLTSQALAFDIVGRNAILRDPHFQGGRYYDQPHTPSVGLAIARMLGHITYLSPQAMQEKFDPDRLRPHDIDTDFEREFSVGSYLAYQGDKFVQRFDANSYLVISKAMDLFDLGATREALAETLGRSDCDWLVVSFSSDWLFTPGQSRDIVDALTLAKKKVTYCEVPSEAGHDGFLLTDEISRFGQLIRAKLEGADEACETRKRGVRSIFHDERVDYDTVLELIPKGASVLDLGCGPGGLLAALKARGEQQICGIEVAEADIIATGRLGVDVIDHDLNLGLPMFEAGRFDFVVLSQTLQAIVDVERVLSEMLRVGRRSIISFPNFAYKPLREMFFRQGQSPKTPGEYGYDWYNTPNRRFPSIKDVDQFCADHGITIEQAVYLDTQIGKRITDDPNLNADTAVYVLTRG